MTNPSEFLHRGQQTALIVIVILVIFAICALGGLMFGLNILDHFSFS